MAKFRKGDEVIMTDNALDNYGEEYRDVVFKILFVSKSTKDHPGYDMGVYPMGLCDLEAPDTSHFRASLYDWELKAR